MTQILKITFNEDLAIGESVSFDVLNNFYTPAFAINLFENWVNLRTSVHQVSLGTSTINPGETSAINFLQAFNIDWINSFGFTTWRENNIVFLKLPFDYLEFQNYVSDNINVDFEILSSDEALLINSIEFLEADINPCANIKVSITTNLLADQIVSPIPSTGNANNPIIFELPRNQNILFHLIRNDGANYYEANTTVSLPSLLIIESSNITIINTPNGANVTANIVSNQLNLEYSLDGINWQSDNFFNSLPDGNYTIYVRDQFGCQKNLDFTITATGIYLPFFYISKSNSIRFANRVNWGDSGNYKNDENTLSCEADVKNAFKQIQLFQTADIITTQFKSNYSTNSVKVVKSDLTEITIPVIKKSNNIGLTDSRDARKYNLGNGKTGVYFTAGNIYDFNTGVDTGEDHSLNGTLPYWAKSGNFIKIGSAWFLIEAIIYDDNKSSDVIVFSNAYTGIDTSVIVGSKYNKFDYEVFEFTIDMLDYMDEEIRVKITATDPNFTTINYLSELISVKVRQLKTVEINYWNDDNTDVFYSTGIRHKLRLLLQKKSGVSEEESEILKTDSTAVLLSSQLYELDEFLFEPLTKELWRKLQIALSCKNVIIDEVAYTKSDGSFETEGPLDKSNLYVLKAKMIKKSGSFKSTSDGNAEFDYSGVSIPGLLDIGNDGFIKY